MIELTQIFRFNKNYKKFRKGAFVQIPVKRYTGQLYLKMVWEEVQELIKTGVLTDSYKNEKK